MKKINFYKLAVALALPQLAGFIGSIFTFDSVDTWYQTLTRPELSPPNWAFGVVWPLLYLMMGIAFYLVWMRCERNGERLALQLFYVQLTLNATWSIVFFGLQNPLSALWLIVGLWVAILATILAFYRISKTAAVLMLPYILWVSFAFYLNQQIVILN